MTGFFHVNDVHCPTCQSKGAKYLGRLSRTSGVIRLADPGKLYECKLCGLLFRRPYPCQTDLTNQYSELPPDLWERKESADFTMAARTILNSLPSGNILDVGCYRGDFLARLPSAYQKFGVEPSRSAQEVSKQLGITIVGSSTEEIRDRKAFFSGITLLDVLEHLPTPLQTLRNLRALLAPGGMILLSTGNTDALPWRLMRLDYWYYFSEHVSFFNPKWFKWAASELSLKVVLLKTFSHFPGPLLAQVRQLARCFTFWTMKSCEGISLLSKALGWIYPFSKVTKWPGPPAAHLWPDHLFVVLRSP